MTRRVRLPATRAHLLMPAPVQRPLPQGASSSSFALLWPLLAHWRLLLVVFCGTGALVAGLRATLARREYEATAVLATVSSQKVPAGLSGLAALSGITAGDVGLLASPDLVASLLTSRRVLVQVALSAVDSGRPGPRVIDRAVDGGAAALPLAKIEGRMRRLVTVDVEKKTGLLRVAVAHRDSALARIVGARLVVAATRTFAEVSKAQAAAQRMGLERRVDSMAVWLRGAEARLADLQNRNRVVVIYSDVGLAQQRLTREIGIAQQAYTQAVTEREAAVARELEQTPALLVVDPVPAELTALPRFAAFYGLAAAVLATFVCATVLYLREGFARHSGDAPGFALPEHAPRGAAHRAAAPAEIASR